MKNKGNIRKQHPQPGAALAGGSGPSAAAGAPVRVTLGAIFAGVSAAASLMLVLEHLGGISLPGCGEDSACAQAANSVWGSVKLGGFTWPVSYLGLAYFLAALLTWLVLRGVVPPAFRNLVRVGALISLGYCGIIVAKWMICPYCLAAHAGNFAFWIVVETAATSRLRLRTAAVSLGSVFAVATLALGIWDAQHRAAAQAKAEQERSETAQQIIERSRQTPPAPPKAPPASNPVATRPAPPPKPPAPPAPPTPKPPATASAPGSKPASLPADTQPATPACFTGRYRVGPEEAAIRIVMFTDYQCNDCYNIEQQLVKLYNTRDDLSVSIKHFPFNTDCNPGMKSTMHANACWAARAAEAAGQLWGPEGFWKMHVWLFEQRGEFQSTAELERGIREIGYDPAGFVRVMTSDATLAAVRADVVEARRYGLFFTPMIFINGVELRGWVAPNALIRTVEQVAATNPPPRSCEADQPDLAHEKYVGDWREQAKLTLPPDKQAWCLGPDSAPVKVVLWGDYQEEGSAKADASIRAFMAGRNDVQYTYRHFPFNSDCNPNLKEQRFPNACRAARAAEAAGKLGGHDGYWKMHVWLMENREQFSDETLRAAAAELGFDADALFAAMDDPAVEANIVDDTQAAKRLPVLRHGMPAGLHSIPTIFVNGRYIPRTQLDGDSVLDDILREAAGE